MCKPSLQAAAAESVGPMDIKRRHTSGSNSSRHCEHI